jgi:DNA-binding NtrC family response regulator
LTDETLKSAAASLVAQSRHGPATVLLSHLDRLPLELQAELVRLFVHRSSLRILATSELAPDELAAHGRLHPQLAAAVSTLVIRLPRLTERREDIPLLAQFFVEEQNSQGDKQLRGLAPEAQDRLIAYAWPGDVAELRSSVNEACARAEGVEITSADLPARLSLAASATRRAPRGPETIILEDFLADIERELIERALREAKGNKARAARFLGLTRPRLYRRMVQLGLEPAATMAIGAGGMAALEKSDAGRGKRQTPTKKKSFAPRSAEPNVPALPSEDAEFVEDIPFEEQPE